MLKIKDDIDLKELEKFGFWEHEITCFSTKNALNKKCRYEWCNGKIKIASGNRHIRIIASGSPNAIDEIYDLIKADMVEKVEE